MKVTIQDMVDIASERGGKCLSNEYVNAHFKLEWQCELGHTWFANPNHIKTGTWCRICSKERVAASQRLDIKSAYEVAKKNNGKCLSTEYVNAKTKLLWQCKEGHQWEAIYDSVSRGSWCKTCAGMDPNSIKDCHKIAKKFNSKTQGVYMIDTDEKRIKALKWTAIRDVWGIGRQHGKRLEAQGIRTAYDFINLPDSWIKKHMSVLELRLKKDLLGLPYIKLEETVPSKKSITTTRSFKNNYSKFHELEERISTYANSCAEKLRKQGSACSAVMIFIHSNSHQKNKEQYRNSSVVTLPYATDSSITICKHAVAGLKGIFRDGIDYKKAGVLLLGLVPSKERQLNLFQPNINKHDSIMKAIDKIHLRFGPHQIKLGNQDLNSTWNMRREHLSKRYTTELKEVITVNNKSEIIL